LIDGDDDSFPNRMVNGPLMILTFEWLELPLPLSLVKDSFSLSEKMHANIVNNIHIID
jgi:hypothetical protein